MKGARIAIFGLGRSGLGVGKAALKVGAEPQVYDEGEEGSLSKREALEEARQLGLPVRLGWQGSFENLESVDLVVVNPAVRNDHPKLVGAAAAGIEVIGEIEFAYRIAKSPIVAITGTNGKSTTTVMTYLCLRACGIDAVLCGNIFGSGYPEAPLTEAAMNSSEVQVLVAEVSSFQLDQTSRFRPAVAGITNIWPDHLDRYASFSAYAEAKHRVFANMKAGDFAVVRANDPAVVPPGRAAAGYRPRGRRGVSEAAYEGPTVLTFGATGEHARVEETELSILDKHVALEDLPFQEPHNYQNACMASLLAYAALRVQGSRFPEGDAGRLLAQSDEKYRIAHPPKPLRPGTPPTTPLVLPEEIIAGLYKFRGLSHRMELVGEKNGVRVINNSMCTNPDAVIKSVQAVRDRTHVLMGGINKGLDFGPLRHYLANHRHQVYLFGRDAESLDEQLGGGHDLYKSMDEAFKAATENATKGEVIMLAPGCASTDSYVDFRDRGNVFRAIATDWLR